MLRLPVLFIVICSFVIILPVSAQPLDGREPVDDVFYHFMPISWRDSDNDSYRFGDFDGMTASLDYLQDLGITAIWMNPIFPSPAYHGYQHGPGDEVNAWFGNEQDFLNFVAAAHDRSIKVFVDFVVYGISQNTVWYQNAYGNPASQYDDWLAFDNYYNTDYLGSRYNSWNGNAVGFIHWNLDNSNATALVTQWAQHWLDPNNDGDPSDGIDGYRLDHVWYEYPTGPNGWGYNIDWWETWNANLEAVNPDVFIFAEQANWGYNGIDLLSAFDAAFTKPFEFAARDALGNESAAPLYSTMAATVNEVPADKMLLGIIGDHDVDRLASVIGDSLEKGKAAAAVLMTQPFPPIIYYGDEIGMRGLKGQYGSDANDIPMREPFKWNRIHSAPMTDYWELNSQAYNNRYSRNNDGRSVEDQDGVSGSLLETYKTLIAARKANEALRRGSYHPITNDCSRIWSFLRYTEDGQTVLVAINVHGSSQTFDLDFEGAEIPGGSTTVRDVITGQYLTNLTDSNLAAYGLTLPAYGWQILELDVIPSDPVPQEIDGQNIPANVGVYNLITTQDNETGMGDNVNELNQMFLTVENETIRGGITGNLDTGGVGLALFVDSVPGGQNTLLTESFPTPPYGIPQIDGMVLDSGFNPDYVLFVNAYASNIYVDIYELETGGAGDKRYMGSGTVNDGDGLLSGGSNTYGMEIALNNQNTAGVTSSSAALADTATSGFEFKLPFQDFGIVSDEGVIKVMAMLVYSSGEIGNQFLPGLGGGYDNLGTVPLDMNDVPGNQYALYALSSLPGDWDHDGDVDEDDFTAFANCQTEPVPSALGPGCTAFDFDSDQDVDLSDFGAFQTLLTQ